MIKDDLKKMRLEMDLSQKEFGKWLSDRVNEMQDASFKAVSPYKRQRIHAWENGDLAVPMKIENIIIKQQLKQKDELIEQLRLKQRRKLKR